MIGKTISHYRIVEKLGEGGMGVVYKAEDTKLKRTVALKFLHPELTREDEARTRFMHEAQAAASLNHPNICTVYEIDEHDGQSFIAMEFLEGEELEDRIERGPLPIDEAISVALAVGEALREAHDRGIIHRDVKPGNVMLTSRGQAKILDFGLARLGAQSKITKADTTLGTAAYMSPEQAAAKAVDRRTDIWSLGVVLYEMIAGERPFAGEYEAAVTHAILNDEPEPLTSRRSNVPMELERIVRKALAKNASERYQHVEDMLVDLLAVRPSSALLRSGRRSAASHIARRPAAVSALVIITVVVVALIVRHFTASSPPAGDRRELDKRTMLVVLPFENLGVSEDEYFANGTTDAITARLASMSGLGVISRQSSMQYKKTSKSIRQIGKELGVDYVLEGTVQREKPGDPGSRIRVIPQLIRVADDTHVWAETYDESMAEVFRVQSDIAERVASQLNVTLREHERSAMQQRPTGDLAAYDDFLRGKEYYNSVDLPSTELAVQLLQRAVARDPKFAEAWATLSMAYRGLFWAFDRPGALAQQTESAKRAEELAPDLPETRLALGSVAYVHRDFNEALRQFEMAQKSRPSADAAMHIGWALRRLGRWEEALNQFADACRLIPNDNNIYADGLGITRTFMRRFDEAERDYDETIRLAPQVAYGYVGKANVLLARDGDVIGAKRFMSEMTRRADAYDIAAVYVTGVPGFSAHLRVFPEIFIEMFDEFESGPIERFRRQQPAAIALTHLSRAISYDAIGDHRSASARYDSARVHYERIIRSNPLSVSLSYYHSMLGYAYAGLGRAQDATREGEEAVRLTPISADAIDGPVLVIGLAEICAMCGEREKAIYYCKMALSVPSNLTPAMLRVDPIWDSVRNDLEFRRLAEGRRQ